MAELRIRLRSHHFVVDKITLRARGAVSDFARKYIQYGTERRPGGQFMKVALKTFAAATHDRSEYRFHINQFKEFEEHIDRDYIRGSMVEVIRDEVPVGIDIDIAMKDEWANKARPDQVKGIEYLLSSEEPVAKMMAAKTGKGKSFMASTAIVERGKRAVGIMKPKYVEKWVDDAHKYWQIAPEDVMVVRGADQLMALLLLATTNQLEAKFIIISNKTMQNWIKLYELHGSEILNMGYACLPDQYASVLQVGCRLIDEVHEDFHLNFKIDLYTNIAWSISLSATLTNYDPFLERMYSLVHPTYGRFVGEAGNKFVIARAVFWNFKYPNKARYKDPRTKNYSQHVLEQYILKSPDVAANYFTMNGKLLDTTLLKDYKPGQSGIVYASSIDMCTTLTSYFEKKYPQLNVQRYVEDDSYEDMLKANLIVSTIGSAGTGFDIPGLKTVLMTTAMLSKQGNIQGLGRLREIPNITQEFMYLVNGDISKHVEYHQRKTVLLKQEAAVVRTDIYPDLI